MANSARQTWPLLMRSGRGCYETNTLRPLSFVPAGALWSGGRDKDNILYWKLALCVCPCERVGFSFFVLSCCEGGGGAQGEY